MICSCGNREMIVPKFVRQWNDTWPEGSAVIVILEATGKRRPKTRTRLADKHQ